MLWCKPTFIARYDTDCCRLFMTQQQLFDFLDAKLRDEQQTEGSSTWLPFGIEFPSEEEAVLELTSRALRRSTRTTTTATTGFSHEGRLFRKRTLSIDTSNEDDEATYLHDTKRGVWHRTGALRKDYGILYGATPLSSQTRMFLAATVGGISRVVQDIEPLQQHLYELIREGSPCHMYLDVERERDYSAWHPVVQVSDSDSGDDNNNSSCVIYERRSLKEYTAMLDTAVWRPPHCCALDCQLRADNSATTRVLLTELCAFLRTAYPELIRATTPVNDNNNNNRDDDDDITTLLGDGVDVIVMRSIQQEQGAKHGGKFSQHYIIKFDGLWFSSNADVGRLVRQFVDFLYARAVMEPRVHVALFYHDTPKEFPVLPSESIKCLPFLPLLCVIDTAVYSRNRMLRCLGSCKLHKLSVLQVERRMGKATMATKRDNVALFFDSLVSLKVGHRTEISIPSPTARTEGVTSSRNDCVHGGNGDGVTQLLSTVNDENYRLLADYVAREWSLFGGVACRVSKIRQYGERYVLFQLDGSRYCGNVGREHLSNHVYITVDLQRRVWAQKCFDPDCASYKSTLREIPGGLLPGDRHDWTRETQTAALTSHASLRTVFRPLS